MKGTVPKLLNFVLNILFKVIEGGWLWSRYRQVKKSRWPGPSGRAVSGQPGVCFVLFDRGEASQFPDEN